MGAASSDLSSGLKKIPPATIICVCCHSDLVEKSGVELDSDGSSTFEQENCQDAVDSGSRSDGGESSDSVGMQTLRPEEKGID